MSRTVPELDMAIEVSNAMDIRDITMIENRCKRFAVSNEKNSYEIFAVTEYEQEKDSNDLLVLVRFKFMAHNSKNENLALLEAVYLAFYASKAEKPFTDNHYTCFAEYCSIFHVWPYWREFVQRSIASLGMPPLTLPVYKFGSKLPKEQGLIQEKQIESKGISKK